MKLTKNTVVRPSIESRELYLFADNNERVYRQFIIPVINALAKHYKSGNFDGEKAIAAFYPAACEAAKIYNRLYGSGNNNCFDVTARYTAAAELRDRYMDDIVEKAAR